MIDPIKIEGLVEFQRNLKTLDANLPKVLRIAHNQGAQIVVNWAQPRVAMKTGRAKASVKARSSQRESKVQGGSTRVPWYAWLDFGGSVGRKRSVKRPFLKGGRYIYAGWDATREDVHQALLAALLDVAREAGVEVEP